MTHKLYILGAVFGLFAGSAQAACQAEYKAKRDNPLQLDHGVMLVQSCTPGAAAQEVRARLAASGWILLKILSVKKTSS